MSTRNGNGNAASAQATARSGFRHAAVIGGGTMGADIAANLLAGGIAVEVVEPDAARHGVPRERSPLAALEVPGRDARTVPAFWSGCPVWRPFPDFYSWRTITSAVNRQTGVSLKIHNPGGRHVR